MDAFSELLVNPSAVLLPPDQTRTDICIIHSACGKCWNVHSSSKMVVIKPSNGFHMTPLRKELGYLRQVYVSALQAHPCFPIAVAQKSISLLQITNGVVVCPCFAWWLKAEALKETWIHSLYVRGWFALSLSLNFVVCKIPGVINIILLHQVNFFCLLKLLWM